MSLKEKINQDLKAAMLSKEEVKLETLRAIRSEIIKFDKSGLNREMTEEDELDILNRLVKQRKESLEMFENAGRLDLVEKEKGQLHILQEYMPKQLSRDEVEKLVDNLISSLGVKSQKEFGKVMSAAVKETKGKFEGKEVQEIVKNKLSNLG